VSFGALESTAWAARRGFPALQKWLESVLTWFNPARFRCIAVQDGPEGTFRATAGEWKGSSLMVGAGELGEQTLDVLTETIEALDVSDNW
jgi:hypothetical protein